MKEDDDELEIEENILKFGRGIIYQNLSKN